MPLAQSALIEVRQIPRLGRGVFARCRIPKGTVIERVPVIVVPARQMQPRQSALADYTYEWGRSTVAIALGYGSLYNHSYRPNAEVQSSGKSLIFVAIRTIRQGQEVTFNYNGTYSRKSVGFRVI
jgi:SET domain-containing protein